MGLAQAAGWIAIIAGIINALVYLLDDIKANDILALVSLIAGVVGYVATWVLYGFGQLVDDIHAMRSNTHINAMNPGNKPQYKPVNSPLSMNGKPANNANNGSSWNDLPSL